MKQRDAAKRSKLEAEGGVEAARSKATSHQKSKRKALKQKGGAPYEDAKQKDKMRKRPAPFQSVDQKAADQGDAAAQFRLGLAYRTGRGVEKSDEEAARWYQKAADQGHAGRPRENSQQNRET